MGAASSRKKDILTLRKLYFVHRRGNRDHQNVFCSAGHQIETVGERNLMTSAPRRSPPKYCWAKTSLLLMSVPKTWPLLCHKKPATGLFYWDWRSRIPP
ncbi:hypothetical protein CgunFtcFv8_008162 [Champsocephalus gunnari]|uniref:Uncharacterized protein n=1 Tax=Champsocephalus gunnari TaxID=52237 RepID=A0AAN8D0N1_CHAGU|nr:hypothetical protein CgunFtcFv8_008162 [Champsocephalus gunnari]